MYIMKIEFIILRQKWNNSFYTSLEDVAMHNNMKLNIWLCLPFFDKKIFELERLVFASAPHGLNGIQCLTLQKRQHPGTLSLKLV